MPDNLATLEAQRSKLLEGEAKMLKDSFPSRRTTPKNLTCRDHDVVEGRCRCKRGVQKSLTATRKLAVVWLNVHTDGRTALGPASR